MLKKPTGKLSVVLFLFAWGFFCVFWSTSVIKDAGFYDKGEHEYIQPEARPYRFWIVASSVFIMGVIGLWRGVVEFRAYRRRGVFGSASPQEELQRQMIKKGWHDDTA